jgi:type VI secretion system protein ImpK
MFGGHFAGENFFRNVTDLLNRPESMEVADVLELHALCLELGYRGRFAIGDASEIYVILQRIREKIGRIRGPYALFRPTQAVPVSIQKTPDKWVKRLAVVTIGLAIFAVLAYVGYAFILHQGTPIASRRERSPSTVTALALGGFHCNPTLLEMAP